MFRRNKTRKLMQEDIAAYQHIVAAQQAYVNTVTYNSMIPIGIVEGMLGVTERDSPKAAHAQLARDKRFLQKLQLDYVKMYGNPVD